MDEKRKLLIDAATKIFSKKGYFSTSVQEIAEQCSMSKASLYKVFSSKEELFIEVFEYHQNMMFQKAFRYSTDESLSPRELLLKQLSTQIEDFIERKDFILMQLKDVPLSENSDFRLLMQRMRFRITQWQKECLLQAYGNHINLYCWDLTITLQGLIKEFLSILANKNEKVNVQAISTYIVDRLDSIVNDLLTTRPNPLLTEERILHFLNLTNSSSISKTDEIDNQFLIIEDYISSYHNEETKNNLTSSLNLLKDEVKAQKPRSFLIDVLLHYFEKEEGLTQITTKLRSLITELYTGGNEWNT
ncbi:TetR/AcrR family transcriptional regulator [Metabacillus litoralis]|uniref:TetR/AcrR family transcriptional regulator n=1 Tax=Metabacillus TaxID=2675233 RepID=UPI0013CE9260|nr:TetR/AcrR family transcriptional regulator [Metabacillus litoralis]MCM3411509.1 TetR/AcrR family transcriptional regulator [Metabacillus litoralis]UHA60508.1 TetR/AcrR family transcriptional regulator [Metabacillus litoralis]